MSVKERLREFIRANKISVREFERICGFSYGFVGNMRISLQPDKIMSIQKCFPDLNTEWLLTGEGEMLKNPPAAQPMAKDELLASVERAFLEFLRATEGNLKTQQETISSQQRTIERLSDLLASSILKDKDRSGSKE